MQSRSSSIFSRDFKNWFYCVLSIKSISKPSSSDSSSSITEKKNKFSFFSNRKQKKFCKFRIVFVYKLTTQWWCFFFGYIWRNGWSLFLFLNKLVNRVNIRLDSFINCWISINIWHHSGLLDLQVNCIYICTIQIKTGRKYASNLSCWRFGSVLSDDHKRTKILVIYR